MKTRNSEHDKLAMRLTGILQKLNNGEHLKVSELAEEFNVHERTIQRDILERFSFLPLEKEKGRFFLPVSFLGKLSYSDLRQFASLAGVKGLFPSLDNYFIRELLDSKIQEVLNIHPPSHERLTFRETDFHDIRKAITQRQHVQFRYDKKGETKTVVAEPYRLINQNGIWYLAAVNDGIPKSYVFGRISHVRVQNTHFVPDNDIQGMLNQEDSIWLNQNKTEAILTISPEISVYFKRRNIISQQTLVKELEDGSLIVSGKFAHPNQILPIVRYWIPYVRILSPVEWQDSMETEIEDYLKK